jgi:hypothetical protein
MVRDLWPSQPIRRLAEGPESATELTSITRQSLQLRCGAGGLQDASHTKGWRLTQNRAALSWHVRFLLRLAGRGGKLSLLRLWQRWEPIAMWLWRVRPVREGSILQFGISPYRGHTTTLADGTTVPSGARIVHLHFDNRRLAAPMGPPARARGPWSTL